MTHRVRLFIFVFLSLSLCFTASLKGLAQATAVRDISVATVAPGDTFTVTVVVTINQNINGLGLDENLPAGWGLTQVDNDGGIYSASETAWLWLQVNAGETRTVVYNVTVPAGIASGQYAIIGVVKSASPQFENPVTGESVVTVEDQCTYAIDPANRHFDENGGNGTVDVTTSRPDCDWTAQKDVAWITITANDNGPGSKTVHYAVAVNSGNQRTGHITIEDKTHTVTQDRADEPCTYSISPASKHFTKNGGTGTINVTTSRSACAWTAQSDAGWITITSGSSGTGNGTVRYRVAANSGAERTGHITIEGQTHTVTQDGIPTVTADFSWTPSEPVIGESVNFHDQSYTPNGIISSWFWDFGDGSASTSQNPQHTYSSVGGYRVCLTVTDNTETSDTACKDILVSPNAPTEVDFSWEPSNPTVGEEVNFHDQSQAPTGYYISSWSWDFGDGSTSTSQNPQHTYSIAGSYSVCLTVTDNTGTSSIGCKDISVGGGTCTYSISPTSKAFDTSGGSGSFKVMTGSGCQWTAQSDSDWITIISGKSGTGNGTVYYTVTADSGSARTGHITVEGQQYTINQGVASCTYTISPTSQSFGASGGTGSFNVMTSRPDCMWIGTVESDADWITITGMTTATLSGGDGTVQYAVAPTPNSGNERTGHIAVEGHTFTVMQGPSPNTPISSTHTYGSARGWYMVSVPLNSGAASDLFGTTAYRWNPATGQYDLPTTIEPTKGYWVNLSASKAVTDTGYEIATDVIIDISSHGWHQISAPWPYPKDDIQVSKAGVTKSWVDAAAAGWVREAIYGYKSTDGEYTTPSTIDPWYGYWVRADASGLSLKLLYTSRTSVSPPTPPLAFTPMDLPSLPGSTPTAPLPENLEFTNIPNPITDVHTTTFMVKGPMAALVEAINVQIFDLSGRLVYEREEAATSMDWHTENQVGETLANGVYLYKMFALIDGEWVESETRKLAILR